MSLSPRLDPTRETSAIAATVSAPAVTASSHPSSDIVTASAPNPHVTPVPYSFSPRRLSSRKRPASAMLGLDKHKSSPQNPPRSSDASPPASIAQLPSSTQLQYQPPSTHSTSAPPQTLRHDTYEYDTQKQLRQQLELMHQAADVQPPNNPAHQPSYTYSTQLNPPQMQGRNQMQDQSTLPSHFYQPVQSVRSRPDDIPADPANLLIESNAAVAQHLFVDNLDSPGSPGNGFKRQRSSADSDAGSSSCKDMDETEVFAPDSVGAFVDQLRKLIHYVQSKPALHNGSASFMRDYLRTMLIQSSLSAEDVVAAASKHHKTEVMAGRRQPVEYFKMIPEELAKHIFNFLDGTNLARAREVCKKWNEFASEEPLWKTLCLQRWRSLETDKDLWRLINRSIDIESPTRWRKIYPRVSKSPQWRCRLQKTGRFICNLIAHQISGTPLGEAGLPGVLVVERRFNILHLQRFVLPDATVLYLEPEQESDRAGFDDFIEYLNRRTRAGLALEDQRRFIFIPPCEYTRTQVEYYGRSLLGVVQNAYPPLEP